MSMTGYYRHETVEGCVKLLADMRGEARVLAGGTDLIPKMKKGKLAVTAVLDLGGVKGLGRIVQEEGGVFVGAMVRLRELEKAESLTGPLAVLRRCAGHVSSMQVRNVATVGGNVCNASPAADTVPGLLVLDAVARIAGPKGDREVPLESFFIGPGETVLGPGELLTGLFVPAPKPRTGAVYRKYSIRGDSDLSIVGAGALVSLDEGGRISAARIALASVGPTPLRMKEAEEMLLGKAPGEALFRDVAAACAESCKPITDHRATAAYRRDMVRVWVSDALQGAALEAAK